MSGNSETNAEIIRRESQVKVDKIIRRMSVEKEKHLEEKHQNPVRSGYDFGVRYAPSDELEKQKDPASACPGYDFGGWELRTANIW